MILGLCGYARSGKDTLGEILVTEYGFTRFAFADALKELAEHANPFIDVSEINAEWPVVEPLERVVASIGWELTKTSTQVRRFLQNLGVGCREVIGPDVWVEVVRRRIAGLPSEGSNVVITDVRFPNEIDFVRTYPNGRVWRIDRPGVGPANDHVSEHAWNDVVPDVVITNDSTVEALSSQIKRLFSRVSS